MPTHEKRRILINGLSAKSGGGRSILSNFIKAAIEEDDEYQYVIAVGSLSDWIVPQSNKIRFVELGFWSSSAFVPVACFFRLPFLARRWGCEAIFNVGDVPIYSNLRQIFLFDWPYAAYPESRAWKLSSRSEWLVRKIKLIIFSIFRKKIDVIIAQNEILARRISSIFKFSCVEIVQNAVSIENLDGGEPRDFNFGEGFKLLCLSRYYAHKNIEILLPVARMIREAGLNVKIVTTLDAKEHIKAKNFLDTLDSECLGDILVNVGPVGMEHVPSLYKQVDALILPTLLESFSGTYVEAMFHGKLVLTSRLDFASGVCRSAALYFDPDCPNDIFQAIRTAMSNEDLRNRKICAGRNILEELPDWHQAYRMFTDIFRNNSRSPL